MTLAEALQQGKALLSSETPKLDTELLLAFVLDKPTSYLLTWPEQTLTATQQEQFQSLLEKRKSGHPVAHLIGTREFWGLPFKVTADTLIPRPDTETLVETALEKMQHTPGCSVLDLGTGSGAVACAFKYERPDSVVTATDFQEAALNIAKRNAEKLDLEIRFLPGNWLDPVKENSFDCILSNPPYIMENDPHLVQGDVRFEPKTALTSGVSGLDDIKKIINQSPKHLNPHGWLLLEHGFNQAELVSELMKKQNFHSVELHYDLGHNPRVTCGQWQG